MAHSTKSQKPDKPYDGYPLFAHATGRWAKKIRGKLYYFGKWDDWQAAVDLFQEQRDDLYAGRKPRTKRDGLTLHELCNRFCDLKEDQADGGEISRRMYEDYRACCKILLTSFGKHRLVADFASDDFESLRSDLAKRYKATALGNRIQRIRSVFKYAYDACLIDAPVRFGPGFKPPSKRILRAARNAKGLMMFEARELRQILKGAPDHLRTMILLASNCGFGNHDIGMLPISALDLKNGWVTFPRPKTAIPRRAKLWPETIEAIKGAIANRKTPKHPEHQGLVFITRCGDCWSKDAAGNAVGKEFTKLVKELGFHRAGRGFYSLRHGYATIAGESCDQVAVDHTMGHSDPSMASVYRERISDQRLEAVAVFVRKWLFRRESQELWQAKRNR